jgi:hypothetical protein
VNPHYAGLLIFLGFFFLFIFRTNCTMDDKCWHEALVYRSSELIQQLFSFSSLSVHIDAFQKHHPSEVC